LDEDEGLLELKEVLQEVKRIKTINYKIVYQIKGKKIVKVIRKA